MKENEKGEIFHKNEEEKDNNIDIIDIIEKINRNFIILKNNNSFIEIDYKSINKIFCLINKAKENLSNIYIDYVIINIDNTNNELENNNNLNEKNYSENYISYLDNVYINILNKINIFNINFNSKKNNNNNNIRINKDSLKKIFGYLNKSLISNSDYINLVILYFENKNDLAKFAIEQKILNKYKNEDIKEDFKGKKNYDLNLKVPLKNDSQNIYELDNIFNKVLNYIDDYDRESDFSDNINNLIIPRETIDEDLIKVVNVSFIEEGILPNEKEKELSNNSKNLRTSSITGRNNNAMACNNNMCNGLCSIF